MVEDLKDLGAGAGARRPGHVPEIHQGLDLHAPAGTPVVAPTRLRVTRVVDGTRAAVNSPRWKAGLYVEGEDRAGRILRFQHLKPGSVSLREGDVLAPGERIGAVAEQGTSGNLHSAPHLHFEVRQGRADGPVLDPLTLLPPTGNRSLDRRIALRLQLSREALA